MGITLVVFAIFMQRKIDPEKKPEPVKDEFVTSIQNRDLNYATENIDPEMVFVTDDSLYHKLDCDLVDATKKKMKLERAIRQKNIPCPSCNF